MPLKNVNDTRKRVNRALHEGVELGVIRDQAYRLSVPFHHEKTRGTPGSGGVAPGDDLGVQQLLDSNVRLLLESKGNLSGHGDPERHSIVSKVNMHWGSHHRGFRDDIPIHSGKCL